MQINFVNCIMYEQNAVFNTSGSATVISVYVFIIYYHKNMFTKFYGIHMKMMYYYYSHGFLSFVNPFSHLYVVSELHFC